MSGDERADAIRLADMLLDEPWTDPDNDLHVLARQLLRGEERIQALEAKYKRLVKFVEEARFVLNAPYEFSLTGTEMTVKRYTGLYSQIEDRPPGAYFELLEPFVRASDYEALEAEVRAWRILVNGDESKPFEAKPWA